jgi:hypothetical protein
MIPWIRLGRIVRKWIQPGGKSKKILSLLPVLVFFLMIDAAGEAVGYLLGTGDAMLKISDIDFHRERFMNAKDKNRYMKNSPTGNDIT